jgi:uncharacterized membrane protein
MAQVLNTNLKFIAKKYSEILKLNINSSTIQSAIENNPYYPSLLSLTESFSRYNVNNGAFNIGADVLEQVEAPFVAYVRTPDQTNDFVLVTDNKSGLITYLYKNKKKVQITLADFVKVYMGVIWMAEPNENILEEDYYKIKRKALLSKIKTTVSISGLFALALFLVISNLKYAPFLPFTTLLLVKLIGATSTIILLAYEIDKNNSVVKNICSAGLQTNCDAVLNSEASRFFGISWGEIGFYYFASTTLYLLIPGLEFPEKVEYLAIVNAFSSAYIPFSIYYQWKVVKRWCTLCLIVQTVLAIEFVWSIITYWQFPISLHHISLQPFSIFLFCAISPIIVWYFLKPLLKKAKDTDFFIPAYKRLRYNPDLFKSLLLQQTKVADDWQELGISLGNPNAENTIIKVCNPYCGPCSKMHPELEEIIKHNNNVKLKIIFTAKNSESDRSAAVVRHLMAIYTNGDEAKTIRALDQWYQPKQKNYEIFKEQFPVHPINLELMKDQIDAMGKWCTEAEIAYTPTLFVNGYRLPDNYTVDELKYIL